MRIQYDLVVELFSSKLKLAQLAVVYTKRALSIISLVLQWFVDNGGINCGDTWVNTISAC